MIKQLTGFSNNSQDLKVLQDDNGQIINDDIDIANLLNTFFASQSTLDDEERDPPPLNNESETELNNIIISETDVLDVLKCLDTNKAYGHDAVSPKMLIEASNQLSYPLCKLFNLSLCYNKYPSTWKIANVVPIFKKNDPKKVENYRPISLLCCISKLFEKCIYKYLHNYIVDHNILSSHQSGFRKGDSTLNQLLFITNEFSKALDEGREIRVVFFDISKAFDRVWHKGLLSKLKSIGIKGNLYNWICSYLSSRKQKVIIKGGESNLLEINAGVPQGSILGPLFFLIFINDIVLEIGCSIKLFADDTSIYVVIENPNQAAETLNINLQKVHKWSKDWLVKFNPQKTESLIITRKLNTTTHPTLFFDNIPIQEVKSHKHLGLIFNTNLHWGEHIDMIIQKATTKICILRSLKFNLDRRTLQTLYFSFIRPIVEYADIIWDNCPQYYKNRLESINIEAGRIITGATKLVSLTCLYKECGWETLNERRIKHKLILFYKILNGLTPDYLQTLIPSQHFQRHDYNTRHSSNYVHINCRNSPFTQLYPFRNTSLERSA